MISCTRTIYGSGVSRLMYYYFSLAVYMSGLLVLRLFGLPASFRTLINPKSGCSKDDVIVKSPLST